MFGDDRPTIDHCYEYHRFGEDRAVRLVRHFAIAAYRTLRSTVVVVTAAVAVVVVVVAGAATLVPELHAATVSRTTATAKVPRTRRA